MLQLTLNILLRECNDYITILKCAPKDQFLEFNIKDGWNPLCEFLKVSIPETEFPHENKKGSYTQEMLDKNPVFKRMQREMTISFSLLAGLTIFCLYKGVTNRNQLLQSGNKLINKIYLQLNDLF